MTKKVEQHMGIKFCRKDGHSSSVTYGMIQKAFGNEAMGHTQVKEWIRPFKEGRASLESDQCSGRPSTRRYQLMIDKVHSAVLDSRRITIRRSPTSWGFCLVWYSPF